MTTAMNIANPVSMGRGSSGKESTSLYQQTLSLIQKLYSIDGFEFYLFPEGVDNLMKSMEKEYCIIDPIAVLWGCFRLGAPLCALFNVLGRKQLSVPDVQGLTTYNKTCQKAIYSFLVACKVEFSLSEDMLFTVSELYKDDTNCLVKAIRTVSRVIEEIESRGLFPPPKSLPFWNLNDHSDPSQPKDNRAKVIHELLDTERSYIDYLQTLQTYRNEVIQANVVSQDTVHLIFANLDELLDFQRRFLIAMEATLSLPPSEQRIGALFFNNEEAFCVYEPMCGNYDHASKVVEQEAEKLAKITMLEPLRQLPSYLIKPVQRICKYPLLLKELIKLSDKESYAYYDELVAGLEAVKRVTDRVNEMKRVEENQKIKADLLEKVEDWKELDPNAFGPLVLSDKFVMISGEVEREYHLYLFELMLICCKDSSKKKKKRNSKVEETVYALKGNIHLNAIASVVDESRPEDQHFELRVYWLDGAVTESFNLRCRNEEQVKLWKERMELLMAEAQKRRRSIAEAVYRNRVSNSSSGRDHMSGMSLHEYEEDMLARSMSESSDQGHSIANMRAYRRSAPASPRPNLVSPTTDGLSQRLTSVNASTRALKIVPPPRSNSSIYGSSQSLKSSGALTAPVQFFSPDPNSPSPVMMAPRRKSSIVAGMESNYFHPDIPAVPMTPSHHRTGPFDGPISPPASNSNSSNGSPVIPTRRQRTNSHSHGQPPALGTLPGSPRSHNPEPSLAFSPLQMSRTGTSGGRDYSSHHHITSSSGNAPGSPQINPRSNQKPQRHRRSVSSPDTHQPEFHFDYEKDPLSPVGESVSHFNYPSEELQFEAPVPPPQLPIPPTPAEDDTQSHQREERKRAISSPAVSYGYTQRSALEDTVSPAYSEDDVPLGQLSLLSVKSQSEGPVNKNMARTTRSTSFTSRPSLKIDPNSYQRNHIGSLNSPSTPTSAGGLTSAFVKIRAHYLDLVLTVTLPSRSTTIKELKSKVERKMKIAGAPIPKDRGLKYLWKEENVQNEPILLEEDDDVTKALLLGRLDDNSVNVFVE